MIKTDEDWFAEANVYTGDDLKLEHAQVCASYFNTARKENLILAVHYEFRVRAFAAYMRGKTNEPMIEMDRSMENTIKHARLDAARAAFYRHMTNLLRC